MTSDPAPRTAFVLGGGGLLGAGEVGMLRALLEAGIRPDLVVGTSVGAINGAYVAADPTVEATERLTELWHQLSAEGGVFSGSLVDRIGTAVRSGTHVHSRGRLRQLLSDHLPVGRIEDLAVPFSCVAACIERAAEHWFEEGSLSDAVMASAAVPGLLKPVRIGDEHFFDGGLVNSIPISRAVEKGATTVYVLQVGRVEKALEPPSKPWEVGMVAFEISRRHRFATDMASIPDDVTVHVLPVGEVVVPEGLAQLRYRDAKRTPQRVEAAYEATVDYLSRQALP